VDFYDRIAGEYDDIVGGAARLQAAGRFAAWLVDSHGAQRVLDVACGTGLHARALTKRGVRVVAADASAAMLQQAKAHAGGAGAGIEWLHSPMESISQVTAGPFDAIMCLGNSLPHLLTDAQLQAALRGFRALLAPTGIAIVQMLNYERVLDRRERIVGVTRRGNTEYVRFYDFLPDRIRFNILQLTWLGDGCEHKLHQTTLRPYRGSSLRDAFTAAGFERTELYGGMDWGPFDSKNSQSLLLVARCAK